MPGRRSPARGPAALAATLVLLVAVPLTATGPIAGEHGDPPAATLGNSKVVLAAADDEDDDGVQ